VRILLLSDIHANMEALEACLAAAPEYDTVINLGDVVGYGASPNEVIDKTREITELCVRGNHDKACAGTVDVENFNPMAAAAAYWTRETLTPANLDWLRALPTGPLRFDQMNGVQFVHGSPLGEDEYLIMAMDATEPLQTSSVPVTFFGHSHIQGGFLLANGHVQQLGVRSREKDKPERHVLLLENGTRYLINPGSVGQPRDGDWRAAFATYDSSDHRVTFFRVPYDVEGAQKRILDAKLPERLASRLSIGR
jgi:diadenosine tetraphosphatase ApaH/serine/threonine PP2A family protein phosphatase